MCLAIPGKVIEVLDQDGLRFGKVSFGGMIKQVCLEYTPEAATGDYVLVHVGFSLSCVDEAEARRTFALLEELGLMNELQDGSVQ